jgi:rubrerythrin
MNIYDFARELEQRDSDLFHRLAEAAAHPGVRKVFEMVAADEAKLAERIAALRGREGTTGRTESFALESLADDFLKLSGELAETRVDDDIGAYAAAARYEEGVCRLFREAAARETDGASGRVLRQIGAQECGEAEELRRAHDFVNAPNEFLAWGEFSNLDEFHNFGRDLG